MEVCELLDLHKLDKVRFLHDIPNKEPKECFRYQASGKLVLETHHFRTKTCVNGDRLTWPRLGTEGMKSAPLLSLLSLDILLHSVRPIFLWAKIVIPSTGLSVRDVWTCFLSIDTLPPKQNPKSRRFDLLYGSKAHDPKICCSNRVKAHHTISFIRAQSNGYETLTSIFRLQLWHLGWFSGLV